MKITVITVCLNSVGTIERTIKSVIAQTCSELEYIVVDGGSDDGTIDIIKKYEDHIDKWISEPDKGIFDAMNKGIEMAEGEVIAFLNSDDWYEKNALQIVEDAFQAENYDCICTDNFYINKEGNVKYYDASVFSMERLHVRMIYFHSAIFCRKAFFSKSNNFNLKYKIAADYDWMLRAMEQGARLRYIHKPVFTFCYGGISSVETIACAGEARQVALSHLSEGQEEYEALINDNYYEIVGSDSDKEILNRELIHLFGESRIVILWGAGTRGGQCIKWLDRSGIKATAIVDADSSKWGKEIQGIRIQSPEFLKDTKCNLIITPEKYIDEIKDCVDKIANADIRVFDFGQLLIDVGRKISE